MHVFILLKSTFYLTCLLTTFTVLEFLLFLLIAGYDSTGRAYLVAFGGADGKF